MFSPQMKIIFYPIVISLLLNIYLTSVWANELEKTIQAYNEAVEDFNKGDYDSSFKKFKVLALDDHAQAQYELYTGRLRFDRRLEIRESEKWLKIAAENGHAAAQFDLGRYYEMGLNGSHNWEEPLNFKRAMTWYEKSAIQGYAKAQLRLGEIYIDEDPLKGLFPQDYKEAKKWFELAADQGNVYAQSNLGEIYRDGLGVPKNYIEAYKWFQLYGLSGPVISFEQRNKIEEEMSRKQIIDANKLALKWIEEHENIE